MAHACMRYTSNTEREGCCSGEGYICGVIYANTWEIKLAWGIQRRNSERGLTAAASSAKGHRDKQVAVPDDDVVGFWKQRSILVQGLDACGLYGGDGSCGVEQQ